MGALNGMQMSHDPAKPHDPAQPVPYRAAPPATASRNQEIRLDAEVHSPPQKRSWRQPALRSERIQNLLSFQISAILHCIALIVLGLLVPNAEKIPLAVSLLVAPQRATEELTIIETKLDHDRIISNPQTSLFEESQTNSAETVEVPSPLSNPIVSGVTSRAVDTYRKLPISDLAVVSTAPTGGGLQGRSSQERARLVVQGGGTPASEKAVELGLKWFAAHQRQDGSWRLDHQSGVRCDCRNPGLTETAIGATGLALLSYLGAGYTHQEGPYQEVIQRGIDYMLGRVKQTQMGGDLREGLGHEMYSHGLGTIVLCEAYAMTADQRLQRPAQSAIDFICQAQNKRGGWRYKPGEEGDTTVTGWQVMALKSAGMAQLHVPPLAIERAKGFLNRVQDGRGAFYGYQTAGKEPGPTSVGLLLRMYLGWVHDDERLERGVNYLARLGPSVNDMYYNYYATQVLHHYGGNQWPGWNEELREYLISTQKTAGHEAGSWYFRDRHGSIGGRHYTTAMCVMMLEVYYRHMPLYDLRF